MEKLSIAPDQAGYSASPPEDMIALQLDGGPSRYRKDLLDATSRVTVQWTVGLTDYTALQTFYKTSVNYGSQAFLVDLVLETPTPSEHKAFFVVDTFRLRSHDGSTYTVTAELEVYPSTDTEYLDSLAAMDTLYATDAETVLSLLEDLVN